jgi:putative flippase GtrA
MARATVHPVGALWRWLLGSDVALAKAVRFSVVGASSVLVFALVTGLLAAFAGWDPKLASLGGYLASLPANFLANRGFAFRSANPVTHDLGRYMTMHGVNMALAAGVMGACVDYLGLHYLFGTAAVMVVIPVASFFVMLLWVFRRPSSI